MPDTLPFEKWHGTGNDFVLVSHSLLTDFTDDISALAIKMCDRHFGIGSDGLISIGLGTTAHFKMRMWNPDGSESAMCGNGLRCVGAHLAISGLPELLPELDIETGKGNVAIDFPEPPAWRAESEHWVRVDLGGPVGEPEVDQNLKVPGIDKPLVFTYVNMGNPHAVIFVDDLSKIPVEDWGPKIENCTQRFPSRVNVEFVQILSQDHVKMRVWERGAGITLSCGSGTSAIQVACHAGKRASDKLIVDVPGGKLITEYSPDNKVFLSGPAVIVFSGEWQ
jgi:diaminopimelate epimerase